LDYLFLAGLTEQSFSQTMSYRNMPLFLSGELLLLPYRSSSR